MANPLELVLVELQEAERELMEMYAVAIRMYTKGVLTPEMRALVHAARDDVSGLEHQVHAVAVAAVGIASESLAARIPQPPVYPDLPEGAQGLDGLHGLGAVQAGLLFAGVVVAIVAVAGLVIIGDELLAVIGEIARHTVSVRANTRRFRLQLLATEARYNRCLRGGNTAAQCMRDIPVPTPNTAPTPAFLTHGWGKWLLIGGAVVAVGAGYWWFKKAGGRLALPRQLELRPTGSLRGAPMRKALAGGYSMTVDA